MSFRGFTVCHVMNMRPYVTCKFVLTKLCSHSQNYEGGVVPVHAMKAYKDTGGTPPLILNLDTSWTSVVNVTPLLLNSQYPSNRRLCVAQSRIGRYSRRVTSLASTGIRTADRLAPSLVAMPTELSRFSRMSS